MINYFLIICMTFMGAVASLFLKKASSSNGLVAILKNGNLYAGGILYVLSALINIYVLRFLDYSVVLPLTSITYVWTMVLSRVVLKEAVTKGKVIGIICIIIGAALIV